MDQAGIFCLRGSTAFAPSIAAVAGLSDQLKHSGALDRSNSILGLMQDAGESWLFELHVPVTVYVIHLLMKHSIPMCELLPTVSSLLQTAVHVTLEAPYVVTNLVPEREGCGVGDHLTRVLQLG